MPAQPPKEAEEKVYDLTSEIVPSPRKSVLMLEDDGDFAEMVDAFLQDYSYQVTRVSNGVDGVRQIIGTDFDLILCDLVMPNLPGDMFYLAVQRAKPHLCNRFIFMTGARADQEWTDFVHMVNGVVLWKPFPLSELLTRMREVLNKR